MDEYTSEIFMGGRNTLGEESGNKGKSGEKSDGEKRNPVITSHPDPSFSILCQ